MGFRLYLGRFATLAIEIAATERTSEDFFSTDLGLNEINKLFGSEAQFPVGNIGAPRGRKSQGFSLKTRFQREENSILVHLGTVLKLKL